MQNNSLDLNFDFNYRAKELHRFLTDMDYQQRVMAALYGLNEVSEGDSYEYLP